MIANATFSLSHCLCYAALAGLFTWFITMLGAATVLLTRRFSTGAMDRMLGFGAGVMLASCFWSLLEPGLAQAERLHLNAWFTAALGLVAGSAVLLLGEALCKRLGLVRRENTSARRCRLLIASITLHNIPEGLAVGVAFGALVAAGNAAALSGACMPRTRAFFFGQLSGFVEPVAAVVGAALAASLQFALPFLLCFAAGAMLWVLLSEMIPESQASPQRTRVTVWTLLGFILMMALDVALG